MRTFIASAQPSMLSPIKNLFFLFGQGFCITGNFATWCLCTEYPTPVPPNNKNIVSLFNFLGKAIIVDSEDQIDLHTVLIGSTPAFFFDLLNEFEDKMQGIVIDKEIRREITILFLTSIISAIKNDESLDALVDSVASKGGTTEAGLRLLRDKNFNSIFSEAVDKGISRAQELSKD